MTGRLVTDAPLPDAGHGSPLAPSCAECHEDDDLDALRVIGGRFLHPGCEPDPAPSDDANRIPPSVARARGRDR